MQRTCSTSSKVTLSLPVITARNRLVSSSAVDVDGCPDRSSSVTFVRPILNVAAHLYTPRCGRALHPYCAESLQRVSALVQLQPTVFVLLHAAFWRIRKAERPYKFCYGTVQLAEERRKVFHSRVGSSCFYLRAN